MKDTVITKVDFRTKTIMGRHLETVPHINRIYADTAESLGKPLRVLEAAAYPVESNLDRVYKESKITRWAYNRSGNLPMARAYLSEIPPKTDYDLIFALYLVDEWMEMPFVLLHRWPDLVLRCTNAMICVLGKDCPQLGITYAKTTFNLGFKEVGVKKYGSDTVIFGKGLK